MLTAPGAAARRGFTFGLVNILRTSERNGLWRRWRLHSFSRSANISSGVALARLNEVRQLEPQCLGVHHLHRVRPPPAVGRDTCPPARVCARTVRRPAALTACACGLKIFAGNSPLASARVSDQNGPFLACPCCADPKRKIVLHRLPRRQIPDKNILLRHNCRFVFRLTRPETARTHVSIRYQTPPPRATNHDPSRRAGGVCGGAEGGGRKGRASGGLRG